MKLIVSDGPAPVTVPNVARKSYDGRGREDPGREARRRAGSTRSTTPCPKDQVIRTEPAAGTQAPRDSAVSVVVSKGTDIVIVPDLTEKTIDAGDASPRRRPASR